MKDKNEQQKAANPELFAGLRKAELERRRARQKRLVAQIRNEAELLSEVLSPADHKIHLEAVQRIQYELATDEFNFRPGYWRRLWAALLNKPI